MRFFEMVSTLFFEVFLGSWGSGEEVLGGGIREQMWRRGFWMEWAIIKERGSVLREGVL